MCHAPVVCLIVLTCQACFGSRSHSARGWSREFTYHLLLFLTEAPSATIDLVNSVLLIDDERNIRSLVSRVLGQDNIEVHTAATGKEGLELADQVDPDLALVDLRLPDID